MVVGRRIIQCAWRLQGAHWGGHEFRPRDATQLLVEVRVSTEAELVGVDDALRHILWCRYFLEKQGYTMEPFIMYQDNRSVMLLVNNGKASRSKRTKHIRIRYFFIQDKINQGEISIEHRPTDQMWIDINLKPKQGQLFRQFCSKLMGVPEDYNDDDYKQAHQITVKALIRASSSP